MGVRKAVIPVAGMGTRFLPATKSLPKEMLPLLNKPAIQYIVEEAVAAGIEDVLLITGRLKRAIEDHFDRIHLVEKHLEMSGKAELLRVVVEPAGLANLHYIRQAEPRGLGHAVLHARWHVGNEPFALLLGDDVYQGDPAAIAQLVAVHEETGMAVVGVLPVSMEETSRYGIADFGPLGGNPAKGPVVVADFVEKPDPADAPSNWAIMGRYVLTPDIFDILERTPKGRGGEIQLTDALRVLAREGRVCVVALRGERYDVGDPVSFVKSTIAMALRDPEMGPEIRDYVTALLAEGVRQAAAAAEEPGAERRA